MYDPTNFVDVFVSYKNQLPSNNGANENFRFKNFGLRNLECVFLLFGCLIFLVKNKKLTKKFRLMKTKSSGV